MEIAGIYYDHAALKTTVLKLSNATS